MDKKRFLIGVREKAQLLDNLVLNEALPVALRILADNLSEAGTEKFAQAMPEEWRHDIERAREKIEHEQDEAIALLAVQAEIEAAAADQITFALYKQLWLALPEDMLRSMIRQVPASVAHSLKAAKPGPKR